jgi:hypothetical protein
MNLADLNYYLDGTEFLYYGKYYGVIHYICDERKVGFYSVYVHGSSKPYNITKTYMKKFYLDRLKRLRMSILKNRNITRLVHFTPADNLESILENGMLSRLYMDENGFDYWYTDENRLDGKLNYISNSITFPNYKMFWSKRNEDKDTDWIVLSIDSDILVDKFDTEFYRKNAAANDPLKYKYEPTSNDALEFMFYPEDRDPNIPTNYTTDPQAEVLIKDDIDTSYITCIDTECPNDKVRSLALNSRISYNPHSRLFSGRNDYARWR